MTSSSSSDRVTTSGVAPWLRPFTTPASAASVDASRSPILSVTLMPELCARSASSQPSAGQHGPQTKQCPPRCCPDKFCKAGKSRVGVEALPVMGKETGDSAGALPGVCQPQARLHPSWLLACASCHWQAALRAHRLPCVSCWRARVAHLPGWRLTCQSQHLHVVQE